MNVDELAERTGETVRTIRFYQAEGVLPRPARRGREVRYDEAHVERLRTISELQQRGLRLSAIRDLLRHAPDTSAAEWLGLSESLEQPWIEDRPGLWSEEELRRHISDAGLGGAAATEGVAIEALVAAGVIERRGDMSPVQYVVPSPGMVEIGLATARLGLPPDVAAHLRDLLQRKLRALADVLVAEFTSAVSFDRLAEPGRGPADLAHLLDQLRPLTRRTVDLLFAHEMERAQRELVDAPPVPRKRKRSATK